VPCHGYRKLECLPTRAGSTLTAAVPSSSRTHQNASEPFCTPNSLSPTSPADTRCPNSSRLNGMPGILPGPDGTTKALDSCIFVALSGRPAVAKAPSPAGGSGSISCVPLPIRGRGNPRTPMHGDCQRREPAYVCAVSSSSPRRGRTSVPSRTLTFPPIRAQPKSPVIPTPKTEERAVSRGWNQGPWTRFTTSLRTRPLRSPLFVRGGVSGDRARTRRCPEARSRRLDRAPASAGA